MISADKYLERIVAGIQSVTTEGADVRWNEKINGRQFDVVVRFTMGKLVYLVLVEVKNHSRRADAGDLDAFVTKARDQLANKAVFVTAAGFQEGAKQTAQRHGVELFTVTFDETEVELSSTASYLTVPHIKLSGLPAQPPTLSVSEPELTLCFDTVDLVFSNRKRYTMPTEQSQMTYYMAKTLFDDGTSLLDFVQTQRFAAIAVEEKRREQIKLPRAKKIQPPDDYYYPTGKLVAMDCQISGVMARGISGTVRIDPNAFRCPVIYTNVLTGEISRFSLDQLPLGNPEITTGSFYFLVHPLRYYHCSAIIGDLVTWKLIESFQNDMLVRSTFTQELQYAAYYIPVTGKAIVSRLERRLADFEALSSGASQQTSPTNLSLGSKWRIPWRRNGNTF